MKGRGKRSGAPSQEGAGPQRPARGASRSDESRRKAPQGSTTGNRPQVGRSGASAGGGRPTGERADRRAQGGRSGGVAAGGRAGAGRPPSTTEEEGGWTYGVRAVESALETQADEIAELWVQDGEPGSARRRIREQAESLGLTLRVVSADQLSRMVGEGANHQGVAALLHAYRYADASALLAEAGDRLIVILDEVQDPHNLGAILRTAVGLGAAGVVIPKHRAVGVTPAVRKVSTGASEMIPVARVTNIVRFIEDAQAAGYWAYGTTVDEGESIDGVSFAGRALLVMGSEGSGIRPLVRRSCDVLVRLPLQDVESLNVSVATGIFLYAWRCRQG